MRSGGSPTQIEGKKVVMNGAIMETSYKLGRRNPEVEGSSKNERHCYVLVEVTRSQIISTFSRSRN